MRWLCNSPESSTPDHICDSAAQNSAAQNFTVGGQPIDFCLSNTLNHENCQLQFSVTILVVVIICNFIKLCCMVLTFLEPSPTLVTIGDAIDDYL